MMPPVGPPQSPPPDPSHPELSGEALENFWRNATGQFTEQTETVLRMRGEAIRRNFKAVGWDYDQAMAEFDPSMSRPDGQPSELSRELQNQIISYQRKESQAVTGKNMTKPNDHAILIVGSAAFKETQPYVDVGESSLSQGLDNGERVRRADYYVRDNRIWCSTASSKPNEWPGMPKEDQLEAYEVAPFLERLGKIRGAVAEQVYPGIN